MIRIIATISMFIQRPSRRAAMLRAIVILAFASAFILFSPASAAAQNATVQLNYFDNSNATADQQIRIINTGEQGSPLSAFGGTMCADIYVFDADQEMVECCACKVPANAVLRLSLKNQLIQRPLTGQVVTAGAIFIVGDRYPGCNETVPRPTSGLLATKVQVQLAGDPNAPTPWLSETNFQSVPLTADQQNFLALGCAFTQYLGNKIKGKCICGLQPGS